MKKISLNSILGQYTKDDFMPYYLEDRPFIVHNQTESFKELFSLSLLNSIDDLLKLWPKEVGSYNQGIADEGNSIKVSISEAKALFHSGRGLYFDDPNTIDSTINKWLMGIKEDLGLSNLTYSRSLIYAIKKGFGTATHFDQNINFVLQVHGTKKWWIAPNTHVKNPMTRHTLGLEIDPELKSYTDSEMPISIPENAIEYTLEPGSMLFVPRGAWHKTEALSDALSLNFTYSAPTWIDLVTTTIRARLVQSEKWRETANFVNDPVLYPKALETLDDLLADLSVDMLDWRASNILGLTES